MADAVFSSAGALRFILLAVFPLLFLISFAPLASAQCVPLDAVEGVLPLVPAGLTLMDLDNRTQVTFASITTTDPASTIPTTFPLPEINYDPLGGEYMVVYLNDSTTRLTLTVKVGDISGALAKPAKDIDLSYLPPVQQAQYPGQVFVLRPKLALSTCKDYMSDFESSGACAVNIQVASSADQLAPGQNIPFKLSVHRGKVIPWRTVIGLAGTGIAAGTSLSFGVEVSISDLPVLFQMQPEQPRDRSTFPQRSNALMYLFAATNPFQWFFPAEPFMTNHCFGSEVDFPTAPLDPDSPGLGLGWSDGSRPPSMSTSSTRPRNSVAATMSVSSSIRKLQSLGYEASLGDEAYTYEADGPTHFPSLAASGRNVPPGQGGNPLADPNFGAAQFDSQLYISLIYATKTSRPDKSNDLNNNLTRFQIGHINQYVVDGSSSSGLSMFGIVGALTVLVLCLFSAAAIIIRRRSALMHEQAEAAAIRAEILAGHGARAPLTRRELDALPQVGPDGRPIRYDAYGRVLPDLGASFDQIKALPQRKFEKGDLEKDDTNSCSICLGDYEEGETLKDLPCGHHFHGGCIDKWLVQRKHCPLCQQDLDKASNVKAHHAAADIAAAEAAPLTAGGPASPDTVPTAAQAAPRSSISINGGAERGSWVSSEGGMSSQRGAAVSGGVAGDADLESARSRSGVAPHPDISRPNSRSGPVVASSVDVQVAAERKEEEAAFLREARAARAARTEERKEAERRETRNEAAGAAAGQSQARRPASAARGTDSNSNTARGRSTGTVTVHVAGKPQ